MGGRKGKAQRVARQVATRPLLSQLPKARWMPHLVAFSQLSEGKGRSRPLLKDERKLNKGPAPRPRHPWKPGRAPSSRSRGAWGGGASGWKITAPRRLIWKALNGDDRAPHPPFDSFKFSPKTKEMKRPSPRPSAPPREKLGHLYLITHSLSQRAG